VLELVEVDLAEVAEEVLDPGGDTNDQLAASGVADLVGVRYLPGQVDEAAGVASKVSSPQRTR